MNPIEGIKKINEYVLAEARTYIANDTAGEILCDDFEIGTLYYHFNDDIKKYVLYMKNHIDKVWGRIPLYALFDNKAITSLYIADKTITNEQIADYTILTNNLADNIINSSKLMDNSVTTLKIADYAVTNNKIAEGAITNNKIQNLTITNDKIANYTITGTKIAPGSITTENIANYAITNKLIADNNITSNKIAPGAISANNIADRSITGIKIAYNTIKSENIEPNTITNDRIANYTINAQKIVAHSITNNEIGYNTIIANNIADGAITSYKLADYSVITNKIADNTIPINKLVPAVQQDITNAIKMTSNGTAYCYGNFIATGTITGSKLYNAVYNDLAEGYIPGEELAPGDIVEVREDGKVYKAIKNSNSIVGVMSDEFATCFGASEKEIQTKEKVPIGLIGKVHVNIFGKVKLGQKIYCMNNGVGSTTKNNAFVGKALETINKEGYHKVLCLIYPN